jgi:hypothetical protein
MATTTHHEEPTMTAETYRTAAANYLAKLATYDREIVAEMAADLRKRNARTRSHETRIATQLMIDCCDVHLATA